MAVYDLEEQEQISQIKAWWEQYGKYVTAIALSAALASVGWQGFRWYQDRQAAEAGALYYAVQQAAERGDAARAREAAGQIIEKFGRTPYAEMAALLSAGVQFAEGDTRNAQAHLQWLANSGRDAVLRDIARLRLATVLLDEGKAAEALTVLEKAPAASLKPRFDDLRGDALVVQGRNDEARAAYRAALEATAPGGARSSELLREVIRIKIESLES